MAAIAAPPMERFNRFTERRGDCLIWIGDVFPGRYQDRPRFVIRTEGDGKKWKGTLAYRWIWEQLVGPIPEGLELDHVKARGCTSPMCVAIEHLEPVTPEENNRRRRLAVCKSGRHDLTLDSNVIFDLDGKRHGCLPCKAEREADRYRDDPAVRQRQREASRKYAAKQREARISISIATTTMKGM